MSRDSKATPYIHRDAPEHHEEERRCTKCSKKVSSYQSAMPENEKVVLCYSCQMVLSDAQLSNPTLNLAMFIGVSRAIHGKEPGIRVPNLKRIRLYRGYTRQELADETGINRSSISKWERNEMGVLPEKLGKLARALGVRVQDLRSEAKGE